MLLVIKRVLGKRILKRKVFTMYKNSSLLFVILLFSTALSAEEKTVVLDCSCDEIPWQQAFDNAQHVVFGEVKEVKKHSDDLATGDFIPMEVFKGQEKHITKLAGSGKTGASCRRVLRQGFYIAYANESHSVVLNNCTSSRQLREQEDLVPVLTELKKYAELKNPAYAAQHASNMDDKKPNNVEQESNVSRIMFILAGVLLLVISAIVFIKKVLPRLNK